MFCQLPDERQSQARAAVFSRQEIFQLLEFLENCFTVFQGDARAGIANGKGNRIVRPAYVEADAAGGGELDGVTQQIVQNLPQARGVSGDLGRRIKWVGVTPALVSARWVFRKVSRTPASVWVRMSWWR